MHSLHSRAFLWEEASFPQERPLIGGLGNRLRFTEPHQVSTEDSVPVPTPNPCYVALALRWALCIVESVYLPCTW